MGGGKAYHHLAAMSTTADWLGALPQVVSGKSSLSPVSLVGPIISSARRSLIPPGLISPSTAKAVGENSILELTTWCWGGCVLRVVSYRTSLLGLRLWDWLHHPDHDSWMIHHRIILLWRRNPGNLTYPCTSLLAVLQSLRYPLMTIDQASSAEKKLRKF